MLVDLVLDVHLLLLVARERGQQVRDHALLLQLLELLLEQVLLAAVPKSHQECHLADLLSALLLHRLLLHERAERRNARAQTRHQDRSLRVRRHRQRAARHRHSHLHRSVRQVQRVQVARAQTHLLHALRRRPRVLHDAQFQRLRHRLLRRRDRVQTRLHRRNHLQQVRQVHAAREVLQHVHHARRLRCELRHQLALTATQRRQRLLLRTLREVAQRLEQLAARTTRQVQHLASQLAHRAHAGELLRQHLIRTAHLHDRLALHAHVRTEALHQRLRVLRVDRQRVAHLVPNVRLLQVEPQVHDVALVVHGCHTHLLHQRN